MKIRYMFEIHLAQTNGHSAGIGASIYENFCGGVLLSAPS